MGLSSLRFASFFLVVFSVEALRHQRVAAGDQPPPPHTVVNLHVLEPAVGADEFQLRSIAHQSKQDSLLKLEGRIAAVEDNTLTTMKALAQEVKHVGDMIGLNMPA